MPICKYEEFLSLIKHKKRILGIDHGSKKIGVAISDESQSLATPLTTIFKKNKDHDFKMLLDIIKNYSVLGVICGWPLNMNGTKGPRCQSVYVFIKNFLSFYDIPILFKDERMSTQAVEKIFINNDVSRKKRYKNLDKHAACWILQSALDSFKK